MFKDSKEGQTHYYGDNCGNPDHNTPTLNRISKQLIKEEKANHKKQIKQFKKWYIDNHKEILQILIVFLLVLLVFQSFYNAIMTRRFLEMFENYNNIHYIR